jgi:hypothetical protein
MYFVFLQLYTHIHPLENALLFALLRFAWLSFVLFESLLHCFVMLCSAFALLSLCFACARLRLARFALLWLCLTLLCFALRRFCFVALSDFCSCSWMVIDLFLMVFIFHQLR